MAEVTRGLGRGCSRSLIIQGAAVAVTLVVIVPLFLLLIVLPLGLVSNTDMSPWLLAVPAGLFLLLIHGGLIAGLVVVLRRRKRRLDAAFEPLGLTGSPYLLWFRQYHGTRAGREVAAYVSRGPALEIEAPTPLRTRLSVTGEHADTRAAARLLGRTPLPLEDPALAGLTVFARDPLWARRLLAHPEVPPLLARLIHFEGWFVRRQVILMPGRLRLHLFGNRNLFRWELPPAQVAQWVDEVLALARRAEAQPAPEVTAEETQAERAAHALRTSNPYLLPAITLGLGLLLVLCTVGAGVIAYLLVA